MEFAISYRYKSIQILQLNNISNKLESQAKYSAYKYKIIFYIISSNLIVFL